MKSYKICKLAARKVLSDNYCVLSIKTTGNSLNDEIIEIGVIDKNDDIVVDMKFKPEVMLEAKPGMKLFQAEYPEIVKKLSEYDHVVLFNESLTKKMFAACICPECDHITKLVWHVDADKDIENSEIVIPRIERKNLVH